MPAKMFSIGNRKGRIGKTAAAVHLAAGLPLAPGRDSLKRFARKCARAMRGTNPVSTPRIGNLP